MHGERVWVLNILDMHVGPAVDALTDDPHRAGFSRLVNQEGDLRTAQVQPAAAAIDHARAEQLRS